MKRFQEVNKLTQLWRLRFYLYLPFVFLYHEYVSPLQIKEYDSEDTWQPIGRMLWRILKGDAQLKMNWTHTMEEVKNELNI